MNSEHSNINNPNIIGDDLNESDTESKSSSQSFNILINKIYVVLDRIKDIAIERIWLILVIFIIGLSISIYKVLNKEVVYKATITFVLQEEDNGSRNNVADPLSAYLLTRATSEGININRMREIVSSQILLSNILYNKCIFNGKEDYLINHILKVYYGRNESYFKSYRGLNGLDRKQFGVFNRVAGILSRSSVVEQTKSGAFILTTKTINEELTKVVIELTYQNLSNFYIDKTTEKAQRNYIFLRNRLDSIRNMLYSSEYQVANFEDRAKNLLLNTAKVPQVRQQRNTVFYESLYSQLLKNFETSKVTLNNITPIFQLLQRPYYPLSVITQSNKMIVIIGLVVTFIFVLLILVLLYLIKYIWPEYKHLLKMDVKEIEEIDKTEQEHEANNNSV